jgi:hypothetical protein
MPSHSTHRTPRRSARRLGGRPAAAQQRSASVGRAADRATAGTPLRRWSASLVASVGLHVIVLLVASVGWARSVPLVMPPPYVVRPAWVEAEVLGAEDSVDPAAAVQATDSVEPGLEEREQGPLAGDPSAAEAPAPTSAASQRLEPAAPTAKPAASPAPAAGQPAPSTTVPAPAAPAGPQPKAEPGSEHGRHGSGAAHADGPAAGSAAPGRGPSDVPPGEGGGYKRSRDPDLGDRFTHDLPSFAQALSAWRDAPLGETGEVQLVLALDAEGKIALPGREAVERLDGRRAVLVESIRRTVDGLYASFALPGGVAGPGKLWLRVRARVSDLPAPPQPRERVEVGSTPLALGRASAYFTLEGGRHVEFTVELVRVEREAAEL